LHNANEQHSTSNQQRDILALLILFQLTLLREIGLQPILSHCVNCKTKYKHRASSIEHPVYFSSSANGLICRDCEPSFPDKIRLTKAASACLASLKQIPGSEENTLKEIEKVLVHHLTGLLGRTPKMAKHILQG